MPGLLCRKCNCSQQSSYRWKAKFGGPEISEVKPLPETKRELEPKVFYSDKAKKIPVTDQTPERGAWPNEEVSKAPRPKRLGGNLMIEPNAG